MAHIDLYFWHFKIWVSKFHPQIYFRLLGNLNTILQKLNHSLKCWFVFFVRFWNKISTHFIIESNKILIGFAWVKHWKKTIFNGFFCKTNYLLRKMKFFQKNVPKLHRFLCFSAFSPCKYSSKYFMVGKLNKTHLITVSCSVCVLYTQFLL